ncbi:pyridoxamine 5'-phosphate oxidase family protein [Janibacter sp. Y6]|uniref:pyridoxamine 5'-phosphate oxidase family protein n=1 Tax=Janibacter sp. Y6 TaxID=2913552 RepID=UPI0034A484CB
MDERPVTTLEQLTEIVGEPLPRVRDKVRTHLTDVDRRWLAATPFVVVATSAADGSVDASPKGDPAGSLVHVLDERTVAIAERPGNRRVGGRARLVADAPWFDDLVVRGHRPVLALVVEVEEVFHHCAKAFLRSGLWEPQTWQPDAVESRAEIAHALERPEDSVEELREYYGERYAQQLY